jgi:hypothetical protein
VRRDCGAFAAAARQPSPECTAPWQIAAFNHATRDQTANPANCVKNACPKTGILNQKSEIRNRSRRFPETGGFSPPHAIFAHVTKNFVRRASTKTTAVGSRFGPQPAPVTPSACRAAAPMQPRKAGMHFR